MSSLISSLSSPSPSKIPPLSKTRAMIVSGGAPAGVDVLSLLPHLEFVVTTSAGTNHIDLDECRRRGIKVANAGGIFSVDIADYAVGLLIDVMQRIFAGDWFVRKCLWPVEGEFRLGNKVWFFLSVFKNCHRKAIIL